MLTESPKEARIRPYAPPQQVQRRVVAASIAYVEGYIHIARTLQHDDVKEHGERARNVLIEIENGKRRYPNVSLAQQSLITWAFDEARKSISFIDFLSGE